MKYRFTDTEIKKLLKNIVVLVDTKEQQNDWITDYFKKHKINFKSQNLKEGDYSAFIKKNEETEKILASIGIHRDLYFTDDILIERKAHLDELAGNLSTKKEIVEHGKIIRKEVRERERFKFELTRIRNCAAKLFLFVEDPDGHRNIRKGNYRSEYTPKSFMGSLKSAEAEFTFTTHYLNKLVMGSEIYLTIYYEIRNMFKKGLVVKQKRNRIPWCYGIQTVPPTTSKTPAPPPRQK